MELTEGKRNPTGFCLLPSPEAQPGGEAVTGTLPAVQNVQAMLLIMTTARPTAIACIVIKSLNVHNSSTGWVLG